jgi:hypothetical protein
MTSNAKWTLAGVAIMLAGIAALYFTSHITPKVTP